ncbi:hypothetical protein ACWCO6_33685, partial [Streptomyces sp. NPDC001809]
MSLPGADELFRTTGGTALQASAPRRAVPAPAGESDTTAAEGSAEHSAADSEASECTRSSWCRRGCRRPRRPASSPGRRRTCRSRR